MNHHGRVNAIIVNYCTPELTLKCVRSILDFGIAIPEDVVIVENASPDASYERLHAGLHDELRPVRLIRASHNNGYGSGLNIGARACAREFILALNPDTYFKDRSLHRALEVMDQQRRVGIIGLDLVYPDGTRQYSARRFYTLLDIAGRRLPIGRYWPLRPMIDRHIMKSAWKLASGSSTFATARPFDADWVMGTGFLIRRTLYEQMGGMDESYFLYMEDVDLCARAWQAGYRVVCIPDVQLVHDHQRQSAAGPFSPAGRMHLKSLARFRKKFRVPLFVPPSASNLSH